MKNGQSRIFYKISYKSGGEVSFADIYPNSLELRKDATFALRVRNQYDTLLDNADFDWTSSNEGVVSVGADGALTAKSRGMATVVAKLKADPSLSDLLEVTVLEQDFIIERINVEASPENPLGVAIKVTNTSASAQPAVCIVGLYDKTTRALIGMNYISKTYAPGENHVISAAFGAAAGTDPEIKAMLWNDWYRGRVLCEAVIR
jgi:hypothetical protein